MIFDWNNCWRKHLLSISSILLGIGTNALFCASALFSQEKQNRLNHEQKFSFELPGVETKLVSLTNRSDSATIIFFLGTECPLAKLYSQRLSKISLDYKNKVRVIGISSNQQDSLDELTQFKKAHEINFAIGKDYQNKFADRCKVTRTPEVLLLDKDLNLKYRGRVDDQYSPGVSRSKPTKHFLTDAVDQLLASKPISLPETEPVGCLIGRVKKSIVESKVSYCNQVTRILQKHCVECHRSGEIGPFALTDYEEVIGWADMMVEVIDDQRMPPWHANPSHGEFKNSRIMTSEEKQVLKDWAAAGMPYGEAKDMPPPQKFTDGWLLPKAPDQTIEMRKKPFKVPATGTVEYQYFVVDPKFKTDKWITAAQVMPGNRSVVHHSIVFVRPPDGSRFRGIGWLSAYVPGQRSTTLPNNHARFIPAGSKFVFQQHYTPTGSPQSDTTKIGLVFADQKKVSHEVITMAGINQEFEIPANNDDFFVKARGGRLPKNSRILSVSPHMHLRGKSFRAYGKTKNEAAILCDVPRYDFNWQHSYEFITPIEISKFESIEFEFSFDNSNNNPVNPDPQNRVGWGDQTDEEMAVAFFDIAVPKDHDNQLESSAPAVKPVNEKARKLARNFFNQFDNDRDGIIKRSELPIATRSFGFNEFDLNNDGKLSEEEVLEVANRRFK